MNSAQPGNERLVSPDGLLRLVVLTIDSDVALGFDGFPWHTHADILEATYQSGVGDVVERWIADLVGGKLIIAVSRIGGTIRDVWVTDNPAAELRYCAAHEHIEFRLWDGTHLEPRTAHGAQTRLRKANWAAPSARQS